jgi:peptidoglycan/LPS O-acetylase OafA/YrhL
VQLIFDERTVLLHDDGGAITGTCHIVLAALLVPSLIAGGPLAWVLALPPMRFIGERSCSLYLMQGIVAVTITALPAADLLYRWMELPMLETGRRAAKTGPAAEAAEPALAQV